MWRTLAPTTAILALTASLGVSGCDDGGSTPGGIYTCERDSALLETEVPCRDDDGCPCGTHCSLGLCTHDCLDDGDCEGDLRCDGFGRCTDSQGRAVDTEARGRLAASPGRLDLLTAEATRRVRLTAEALDSGPVRVVGGPGVLVQCDPEADFASECLVDNVPAIGDGVVVAVRSDGAVPDDEPDSSEVTFFAEGQRLAVPVRRGGAGGAGVDREPGVYRGFLSPRAAGSAARSRVQELPDAVRRIRLPVTATVFPASGETHMVSIEDELGVMFASGEGVGRLVYNEDGVWELQLPARHVIGPDSPGAGDVEVYVAASASEVQWRGGSLTTTFRTSFAGVTAEDYVPFLEWELSLALGEDVPGDATPPTWPGDFVPVAGPERAADPLPVEPLVRTALSEELAALGVDGTPLDWAEATICTDDGAPGPAAFSDGILQIAGADAPSGDLACDLDGSTAAAPTFGLMSASLLRVNENIADCLADLDEVRLAVEEGDPEAPLRTRGCVAPGRVVAALGYALEPDRARALGDPTLPSPEASTVGLRLLQQWLETHVFVAQEARQVQALNDILGESAVAQEFTVPDAYLAALRGWDLLLHPRIGVPLAAAAAPVLLEPDYRDALFPAGGFPDRLTYTQQTGIAVSMLDALGRDLDVLNALVEDGRSRRIPATDVEPLVAETVPRAFVVLALAQALHDTASSAAVPDWEPDWSSALEGVSARLTGLMEAIELMRADANPLGIEEGDLPLYRVGDEESANQRFSALTDYLVGGFGDDEAVAPYMVARAATALDSARDGWLANVDRDYEAELSEAARQDRVDAIRSEYEGVVASLCGLESFDLDDWATIDPDACHILPDCRPTDEDLMARLSTAELGFSLCMTSLLRQRFGAAVRVPSPELSRALDDMASDFSDPTSRYPFVIGSFTGTGDTLSAVLENAAGTELAAVPIFALAEVETNLDDRIPGEAFQRVLEQCMAMRQETEELQPGEAPASCEMADDCPAGYACQEGACWPSMGGAGQPPTCLRGTLGAQVLALQAAAREVEMARSELLEQSERYQIAFASCQIMAESNRREESLLRITNYVLTGLNAAKLIADSAAAIAQVGVDCAMMTGPWDKPYGGVFATVRAVAEVASLVLDTAMTEVERYRDQALTVMQNYEEETICLNDASMELVGVRTAVMRIEQAMNGHAAALLELQSLRRELRGALAGGHVDVAEAASRVISPIATDFWLDEDVARYRAALRRARRVVYLGVVAAEYEFQLSLDYRDDVLAARSPLDLEAVVDGLRAYTATGTLDGAAPSDLVTVVSLRDHLLQVADQTGYPEGWHRLSSAERVRLLLTSPQLAVHDEDGTYLGQEIPFTITPFGTVGIGEGQGIPILAGTDCAERLWSVNASLLGDDLYVGSDTTFTRVVLRKRNTFYSQLCSGEGDDPFQVASTRPSHNLFLDPFSDPDESDASRMPQPDSGAIDEVNAFTDARISAYFNVARADLEDEEYANGDSQELAGRGLYGDYALFIPAETISVDGSPGLVLEGVQDVLLRLDYVSVAGGR